MSMAAACTIGQTAEEEVEVDNQEDEMGDSTSANGDAGIMEPYGEVGQSQVCLLTEPESSN